MRSRLPFTLGNAFGLIVAFALAGAVVAVQEEKPCAEEPQTGVPEDGGTQMGGANPDKSECPPEDPPPPPTPEPVPCEDGYSCYPCYCWYPCAYPMDGANDTTDGSAGNESVALLYCPCYYVLDASGNATTESDPSSAPVYYCPPPPPCYYESLSVTSDADAANTTPSDDWVICPAPEEVEA